MDLKTTNVFLVLFLLVAASSAVGQGKDSEEQHSRIGLEYRTFRVAFIPGLSSNGIDADQYISKYSLNILGGYNGALEEGFELGGLVNINKYYAQGVQIAGLGNYSGQETSGVQLAGLFNISQEDLQGVQISGIGNHSSDDIQGIQLSGAFNWSGGDTQGIQISGIANRARDDAQGLFLSGVGNIAGNNMQGITTSGVVNYAGGDIQGLLFSGVLNYSETFQGIAVSTINIADEFQGIQTGVINATRFGQGIQLGVINYGREFEGVPVGLISYYEDGRSEVDLWTSDGGFTNIGLKLGTDKIYNMFSVGYNPALDNDVWQLGWSIGRLHDYKTHFLYTDFSYVKINEGNWTSDLNSIIKYRLLFGKEIGSEIKLYGGPTFNMLISKKESSDQYTWYRLFDFGAKNRDYVFWIGYSVGLELF